MKTVYSAPISVPLIGDQVVAYSKPVLLAATSARVTIRIEERTDTERSLLEKTICKIVDYYLHKGDTNIQLKTQSGYFSHYSGYTSAFIVASVAALLDFHVQGTMVDNAEINKLAYEVEKALGRQALGFYTSGSSMGGLLYCRKEFEFLKSISCLNFKIPDCIQKNLYLWHSNDENMCTNKLRELYNQNPSKIESILSIIERNTRKMVVSLVKEDAALFQTSLVAYKDSLIKLGFYSDNLEKYATHIAKNGILIPLSSKKGITFLVYVENKGVIQRFTEKFNGTYEHFVLSEQGVQKNFT